MSHEVKYICIAVVRISDELHRVYRAGDSGTGLNWRKHDAVGRVSNTSICFFLVNPKFLDKKSRRSFIPPRGEKKNTLCEKNIFSTFFTLICEVTFLLFSIIQLIARRE